LLLRTMIKTQALALAVLVALLAGSRADDAASPAFGAGITLTPFISSGLTSPVGIVSPGDGSGRMFVVEQGGDIEVYSSAGSHLGTFLDVTTLITQSSEQGLLGLAFHPDYDSNGFFFINYTDLSGNQVVSRWEVSGNPNIADAGSEEPIISIPMNPPFDTNHNGGQLAFGPDDYLYIGVGDGGNAGDPEDNAQDNNVLLGKILRIDVDGALPYVVPATNPLVGQPGLDEIWANGLRNPWRFSFDRLTGDLFIGDVGQFNWEEVDFQADGVTALRNYGWRVMEGTHCHIPASGCTVTGTLPILEYGHVDGNCSITGGFRYRGSDAPFLAAKYVYGDLCSGKIWAATLSGSTWTAVELIDSPHFISSFGEDEDGELYLVHYFGAVYKLEQPPDGDGDGTVDPDDNCVSIPNPGQENSDGTIDLSPPKAYDDVTRANSDVFGDACDADDDNDGIADTDEGVFPAPGCGAATAATSVTLADTDGDRAYDRAECVLGYDPANAASVPPPSIAPDADNDGLPNGVEATLGSNANNADTDGDALRDGLEFRHYNTLTTASNTDGDVCGDAREVASINADTSVNVIDLSQVASTFGPAGSPNYLVNMDTNKDGTVNVLDLSFVAQRLGNCP
jgi:glucose/arabinose dehydrogenase